MGWIVGILIMGLIVIAALIVSGKAAIAEAKDSRSDAGFAKWVSRAVAGGFVLLIVIVTLVSTVHSVDAGEVGVVRTFGKITGQRDSGLQFIMPWQSMDTVNVKTQRYGNSVLKADTTDQFVLPVFTAFSKETQDVFIRATLVYHVAPENVQQLIRSAGMDYFDTLAVPSLVENLLKEQTVLYSAVDIAPNRETIRQAVAQRLNEELAKRSITVDQFTIDNMDFDQQFKQAIADKAAASQQAQAEQNKIAVAQAQAQQSVETAKGAAQIVTINADAQADANKTISASLTPALIQYLGVQKLAPNVQIALIPSGQGIIIDPSTILGVK